MLKIWVINFRIVIFKRFPLIWIIFSLNISEFWPLTEAQLRRAVSAPFCKGNSEASWSDRHLRLASVKKQLYTSFLGTRSTCHIANSPRICPNRLTDTRLTHLTGQGNRQTDQNFVSQTYGFVKDSNIKLSQGHRCEGSWQNTAATWPAELVVWRARQWGGLSRNRL